VTKIDEEASDFADYLMADIDNKGKHLLGKSNQVNFTPAIYQSVWCHISVPKLVTRTRGISTSCNARQARLQMF
jgi:hypothetical protein